MALQAYIDDSRDVSGIYVLAGYIASTEQWANFSLEWEEMLRHSVLQHDGHYRFKMSEMALVPERVSRVPYFHKIINDNVAMSLACVLDTALLHRAIDRLVGEFVSGDKTVGKIDIAPLTKKWKDPFFFAYRALMDTLHRAQAEDSILIPVDGKVDFFFDMDSNKELILDGWQAYLANRPEEFKSFYGAPPRFEDDEKFLPLQAADFRAWWVRKWAVEYGLDNVNKGTYPFSTAAKPVHNVIMTPTEDHISRSVAGAVGESLVAFFNSIRNAQ